MACWVNISADILKFFVLLCFVVFFQKIDFDILCKLSPGDNLHEMSKPIFWKKKYIISLLSDELAQRLVKVKEFSLHWDFMVSIPK